MHGHAIQHARMLSALSPEKWVPAPHPLGPIRQHADTARIAVSPPRATLYAHTGRPSIASEKLRRALLRQVRYILRSERLVREALEYNLRFRWCVGLDWDAPVWEVTVSPRTGIACGRVRWPRRSSRKCWHKPRPIASCPTSPSRSMARCSKPGRARSASS